MGIPEFTASDVLKNEYNENYLRTRGREIKIIKYITGMATDNVYVPNIVWYEIADHFLHGVMKISNTFTNLVSL